MARRAVGCGHRRRPAASREREGRTQTPSEAGAWWWEPGRPPGGHIFIDRARAPGAVPSGTMAHLPRSQAATLGRTGDMTDTGGEVEHRILASAEQQLLASLAKQRISNATVPPKIFQRTILRHPDDPSFQRTHFGEGAAEVRALSERDNCANPWDGIHRILPGVAALKQSRAMRHEHVAAAWANERERLTERARAHVARRVHDFREILAASDESLAKETAVYASDEALVELQTEDIEQIWNSAVTARLADRQTWIDGLEFDVTNASMDAKEEMARALSHTVDALCAIAYHTRGDVERFAASETMDINAASIEDRRGMAELLARLRTREIERERRERRSYDDAMVRWRTLRTERSVSLFVDLIESDHMSDNAARLEVTRELAEDQTKARDSLVTHIDAFKKLLPDEDADVDPGELNPRSVKAWAKGTYIFISHMGDSID